MIHELLVGEEASGGSPTMRECREAHKKQGDVAKSTSVGERAHSQASAGETGAGRGGRGGVGTASAAAHVSNKIRGESR